MGWISGYEVYVIVPLLIFLGCVFQEMCSPEKNR